MLPVTRVARNRRGNGVTGRQQTSWLRWLLVSLFAASLLLTYVLLVSNDTEANYPDIRNGARGARSNQPSSEHSESGGDDVGDDEDVEVSTVEPFHGPTSGGVMVTISGIGFAQGVQALIGGVPCAQTSVLDAETIHCVAPAGIGRSLSVQVAKPSRGTVLRSKPNSLFSYDAPRVDAIAPARGNTKGGFLLRVTGANFGPDDAALPAVTVGGAFCVDVERRNDGELSCRAPRNEEGQHELLVAVGSGTHTAESLPGALVSYSMSPQERLAKESAHLLGGLDLRTQRTQLLLSKHALGPANELTWQDDFPGGRNGWEYVLPQMVADALPRQSKPKWHGRCAVVMNSAHVTSGQHGVDIDAADAVFRFNDAPTGGFEAFVGSKTTYRIAQAAFARSLLTHDPLKLPSLWSPDAALWLAAPGLPGLLPAIKQTCATATVELVNPAWLQHITSLYKELKGRIEAVQRQVAQSIAKGVQASLSEHAAGALTPAGSLQDDSKATQEARRGDAAGPVMIHDVAGPAHDPEHPWRGAGWGTSNHKHQIGAAFSDDDDDSFSSVGHGAGSHMAAGFAGRSLLSTHPPLSRTLAGADDDEDATDDADVGASTGDGELERGEELSGQDHEQDDATQPVLLSKQPVKVSQLAALVLTASEAKEPAESGAVPPPEFMAAALAMHVCDATDVYGYHRFDDIQRDAWPDYAPYFGRTGKAWDAYRVLDSSRLGDMDVDVDLAILSLLEMSGNVRFVPVAL